MKIRRLISHPTMDFILDESQEMPFDDLFIPGDKIREGFESGDITKVTFEFKSGSTIIFEKVEEKDDH